YRCRLSLLVVSHSPSTPHLYTLSLHDALPISKAITSSFVQPVMSGIVISPSVSNNTLLFGSTSLSGDTDCLTTLSPLPMTIGSRDLPFTLSCAFCVS